jgi:TPR repeat protein
MSIKKSVFLAGCGGLRGRDIPWRVLLTAIVFIAGSALAHAKPADVPGQTLRTEFLLASPSTRSPLAGMRAGRATRSDLIGVLHARANRGDADAQFRLARLFASGSGPDLEQDLVAAARWMESAAAKGHADAQEALAGMYFVGLGVERDATLATHWWQLAADQGRAAAQFNLGLQYAVGNGVPADSAEAAFWWALAAREGMAAAQFNLGIMYMKGEGVDENFEEAVRLWEMSANQGFEQAVKLLRMVQPLR